MKIDATEYVAAIDFITKNNPYIDGDPEKAQSYLDSCLNSLANRPDITFSSTGGFCVYRVGGDYVKIFVDPAVGQDDIYIDWSGSSER